jgi:hypothetical protein
MLAFEWQIEKERQELAFQHGGLGQCRIWTRDCCIAVRILVKLKIGSSTASAPILFSSPLSAFSTPPLPPPPPPSGRSIPTVFRQRPAVVAGPLPSHWLAWLLAYRPHCRAHLTTSRHHRHCLLLHRPDIIKQGFETLSAAARCDAAWTWTNVLKS